MKVVFGAIVCITLLCAVTAVIKVDVSSKQFVDEDDRVRIFHGLNVVYKLEPFHPKLDAFDPMYSLVDEDMKNLRSWGFNVLRLGVQWEGTNKVEGTYNTTYLGIMRSIVDKLNHYGIYVLVDAHQDVLSRKFCGEGAPDWAVEDHKLFGFPFPLPFKFDKDPTTGYPNLDQCRKRQFSEYYFSYAAGQAIQKLYTDERITKGFSGHWLATAKVFGDAQNVLGYELLNEPFPGNPWRHPSQLKGAVTDKTLLMPFYQKLHKAIRSVDDQHIIFYEPTVTESYVFQQTGFTEGPGGPSYNDRQALSYHIYCMAQNSTGDPKNLKLCNLNEELGWRAVEKETARLGGGSMLTEFGAYGPNELSAKAINYMMNEADKHTQSWAFWSFKNMQDITTQNPHTETLYNGDGSLQKLKLKALSRTYAQAVAGYGDSINMVFNPKDGAFILEYENRASAKQVTEIYLNEDLWYSGGYQVVISPSSAATWTSTEKNYIQVIHAASLPDKAKVDISIFADVH